jgi:hypothetical protein
MNHAIRTTLSADLIILRDNDLPPRVDVALTSGLSRTEMTSNQSLQNLVTSISHDRTVLGMSESLASGGGYRMLRSDLSSEACTSDSQSNLGCPYRATASGSRSNSE